MSSENDPGYDHAESVKVNQITVFPLHRQSAPQAYVGSDSPEKFILDKMSLISADSCCYLRMGLSDSWNTHVTSNSFTVFHSVPELLRLSIPLQLANLNHNCILLIPAYKQKLKQEVAVTRSLRKWSEDADAKLQECFASTDWNMFPGILPMAFRSTPHQAEP